MSDRGALPDDEPGIPDFEEVIARARAAEPRANEAEAAPSPVATRPAAAVARPVPPSTPEPSDVVPPRQEPGPARPVSPARAMAIYLTALRALLNEATESRRAWVRQIGIMMQDARTRPMAMVSPMAGKIGSEQMSRFGELRERVQKLEPPPGCADLQALLHGWLDRHMEVCQLLVDFGRNGDLGKLKASQGLLAEGRLDLQRFQAEYTKRVGTLKRQVDAAKKKRKAKWPFGRPKTE